MSQETKPIPAIATRALKMLEAAFQVEFQAALGEAGDLVGLKAEDKWMVNVERTAFVREVEDTPETPE